ncbi:hypothetical protein RCL1_006448 [Eukaryota sp. TZLM3-RCL]
MVVLKTVRIIESQFPNRPGTVLFVSSYDDFESLPEHTHSDVPVYYKQTICVNLVKKVFTESGLRSTKRDHMYSIRYGKAPPVETFKQLLPNQRVNHYLGTFALGCKSNLARNLSALSRRFGNANFSFVPPTYLLPEEAAGLRKYVSDNKGNRYIRKPKSGARGIGIRVLTEQELLDCTLSKLNCVVQKYIPSYLIDGLKFDCRLYVAVTSFDPLIIYCFDNGLARFATIPMSHSSRSTSRLMHLTNYSIQKKAKNFVANNDLDNDGVGSKWSLVALMQRLEAEGHDTVVLWREIYDVLVKTVISAEGHINTKVKMATLMKTPAFEVFGFDILLDPNLKPYLLECNTSPSMNGASPLDKAVKSQMMSSLLTMLRLVPFNGDEVVSSIEAEKRARLFRPSSSRVTQRCSASSLNAENWFDNLTHSELSVICDYEDELSLCRGWTPLFPCIDDSYDRYFTYPRHLNTVLRKWLIFKRRNHNCKEVLIQRLKLNKSY